MSGYRVVDARAFVNIDGVYKIYLFSPPSSGRLDVTPSEAAVILAVCRTQRPCHWDGERFTTFDNAPVVVDKVPTRSQEIRAWELAVDTATHVVDFYLGFAGPNLRRSSGLPEKIVWHRHTVPHEQGPIVLEILMSKYARLSNGEIGNSDIGGLGSD